MGALEKRTKALSPYNSNLKQFPLRLLRCKSESNQKREDTSKASVTRDFILLTPIFFNMLIYIFLGIFVKTFHKVSLTKTVESKGRLRSFNNLFSCNNFTASVLENVSHINVCYL